MSASAASLAGVRAPAVRSAAAKSASVTKRARVSARPARAARGVLQVAAAGDAAVESLQFLKPEEAKAVRDAFGTPAYVYDLARLEEQAEKALAFPNAFGLTVRYAMKASPNAAILKVFRKKGLNIDASSGYEVRRAVKAGFDYADISLSTQEFPDFFPELVERGLKVNACSLSQLEAFGEAFPGGEIGLRFNPGLGSGGTGKTNVGGPSSSFGIWHELLPEAKALCEKYELNVVRIHTHIGSGSDPAVWMKTSGMSLDLCREFPTVKTLNLGGGYKVGAHGVREIHRSADRRRAGEGTVRGVQSGNRHRASLGDRTRHLSARQLVRDCDHRAGQGYDRHGRGPRVFETRRGHDRGFKTVPVRRAAPARRRRRRRDHAEDDLRSTSSSDTAASRVTC